MKDANLSEISSLFFTTRQIIRSQLPGGVTPDPNNWLRCETLHFINGHSEVTMQELAGYLLVKAPSVTSLVANLLKTGLVARRHSKEDKRVVYISLTKKGQKVLSKYQRDAAETMRRVFSRLNDREIQQLIRVLRRVQEIHK